jgi:2-polyprenyl-3-methyl-5-hydroxy-6-metoxy-1,4-benzoquinol methylase
MARQPHLIYTQKWLTKQAAGAAASARAAVPEILNVLPDARSVVDVGCGAGTWLAQFRVAGIATVKGYDGGEVAPEQLQIPPECFETVDLTAPPAVDRRYDLALSLEVAEHLPESAAATFIRFLTELSDTVVFSAAIPGQGGRDHINEQPASYWQALFAAHGYDVSNVLRTRLWRNHSVAGYYRQNMLLAMKRGTRLGIARVASDGLIDVVHPDNFAGRPSRTKRRMYRAKLIGVGVVIGAVIGLLAH